MQTAVLLHGYAGVVREVYEAIVIGGGAAGLSAALVLGRSCRKTLVVDDGRPRNAVASHMHGLLSRDGTPPSELLATARAQLREYDAYVACVQTHVDAISGEPGAFTVRTSDGTEYDTRRIVLATGVVDALPAIDGLREAWGRTVFVCPYCDGWEVRGRRLAAVGVGVKAVELAQELRGWSTDLLICPQGDEALTPSAREWIRATAIEVRLPRICRVASEHGQPVSLEFEDASKAACDAVFISAPLRPRHPLVDMLGCRLRGDGEIEIDERGRTSVPGIYAAGDAVTTVHQVVLAAASGACAAMAINEDRMNEQVREQLTGIQRL